MFIFSAKSNVLTENSGSVAARLATASTGARATLWTDRVRARTAGQAGNVISDRAWIRPPTGLSVHSSARATRITPICESFDN